MVTHEHQPSAIRNGLLAALPQEDLARLRHGLRPVELPFDHTLYPAESVVDAVLFVESGMVSLLATLEGGEQVEVGVVGPEGLLGLPLVFGDNHSLVEIRARWRARRCGSVPRRSAPPWRRARCCGRCCTATPCFSRRR